MRLIEFKKTKEGEVLSQAWVTFGAYAGRGLYVSFCLPAFKMTQTSWASCNDIYGWYGLRMLVGYQLTKVNQRYKFALKGGSWWELLKLIAFVTREQELNKAVK